ncbi:MAG: hypothetical protein IJA44_04430 [Clostridia bacterium]|nr:hypothetical protein [Clostridia bacterium]
MKKFTAVLLCFIMLFSLGALTVSAAEKDDVKLAQAKADYADYFYGGYTVEYVVNYVAGMFVNEEDEIFDKDTMTHPFNGDTINKYLDENFVFSGDMFSEVQKGLGYDADTNIYHLPFVGGFGGMNKPREYVSYVKNNGKYTLYYQTIDWLYLPDDELKKIEQEDEWPSKVTYNGKTYENSADGYVCNAGYKDGGLAHTFDIKNGIARFISTEKYTGNKVPVQKPADKEENKTEDKTESESTTPEPSKPEQTVTQTEGLVLSAVENTFDKDTVVKAEIITESAEKFEKVNTALKEVANKFVAYEITATKNNVTVQPNGTVTATFDIPKDFDLEKIAVFYVSNDGKTEELSSKVDAANGKVTATLTHFSTYVVAEKIVVETNDITTDDGDIEKQPISPWLIIAIVVFVLATAALVVILVIKFKKK